MYLVCELSIIPTKRNNEVSIEDYDKFRVQVERAERQRKPRQPYCMFHCEKILSVWIGHL